MCLAGAMAELGRKPTETAWVETYLFNSNAFKAPKVSRVRFASYETPR